MTSLTETYAEKLKGTWTIEPSHSNVGFSVRHAMVANVRGSFGDVNGTISLDPADPAKSSATFEAQMASITTASEQRDAHLRSPDFFDVEQYPTMTFRSTGATAGSNEDEYRLTGELTIRDQTNEVELDVTFLGVATDPFGMERAGFELRGTIDRTKWGLTWNSALETGGVLVSEKVKLEIEVSAVRAG